MKVHELPFNDTIKADFELIMRRVLSKFPAAKIYTIPDADLAEIQVLLPLWHLLLGCNIKLFRCFSSSETPLYTMVQ